MGLGFGWISCVYVKLRNDGNINRERTWAVVTKFLCSEGYYIINKRAKNKKLRIPAFGMKLSCISSQMVSLRKLCKRLSDEDVQYI